MPRAPLPDQGTGLPTGGLDVVSTQPVAGVDAVAPVGGVRRLVGRLPALRFGLAGQGLTFVAMVVPILLREGAQVATLVFCSAIASGLFGSALLGYQFVYPVIRGPRAAAVATRLAFVGLACTAAAVLPFTLLEGRLGVPGGTFAATAGLLVTMGLYSIALTQVVRAGDQRGIGVIRLQYGVAMLALTLVASLWSTTPLGLTLATSVAYLAPAIALAVRRRSAPPGPSISAAARRRLTRALLRRSVQPTFSSLATGWAFFLPGIALPGLGVAAQPWAIVTRICGGFSTVLQQIVAPPLEARMARAVRERDRHEFARARRTALLVGGGLSLSAIVTGLGLALYQNRSDAGEWLGPVALATVLFFGLLLATHPVNRVPNFVGRHGARLVWDAVRASLVTVTFLLTDGVGRLVAIGVVLTVFGLLLLPLSRWRGGIS